MNENLDLQKECPISTSSPCDWKFLYLSTGQYKDLSIYQCRTCGLQSQFPRQIQNTLYDENYYKGKAEYSYHDERQTERYHRYVWKARIENIFKHKSLPIHFLDVGSSFGGFLQQAKDMGCTVQGVEISSYAATYSQDRGIPTFCGTLIDAKFPDHSFDVITMVEVIEHLEQPNLHFAELSRIVKPGGLLLLQTANFEGWQAIREGSSYHYYMPGHVYYYSESNLKKILTQHGFTHFISYFGVDFSLFAKLKKSRGNFKKISDYFQWIRISWYHLKSKWKKNGRPLTSSFVLYAWKKK
ncbi:methyltransferase/methylase [Leptospira ryugenii]|uniref:Methyltransferase/methylase n=1 Tax=Leptospira ryugenii TaxID=1917863 RepID=A0A2P2DXH9_9LEPT|nr:class I SAM-dependent methyltransferase [Leptospira ryugenii]GBF49280.1 methyltransferase/methylase [Leptospira ryugenii]